MIELESEIRIERPVPEVFAFVAGRIHAAIRENLGKLKELLESGTTTLRDGRVVTL